MLAVTDAAPTPDLNPIVDVQLLLHYAFMQHAFEAGAVVAVTAGVIGYFVLMRSSSFAAHALSHIGFAGATGAVVVGLSPVVGLLAFTVAAAAVMGALGNRLRGRDVTIGIVLAWTLGLGVLFLSLYNRSAPVAYALISGQILGISTAYVMVTVVAGVVTLAALAAISRPLLFASVDE